MENKGAAKTKAPLSGSKRSIDATHVDGNDSDHNNNGDSKPPAKYTNVQSNARPSSSSSSSAFSIEWLNNNNNDTPVGMDNGDRIYHMAHITIGNSNHHSKPFLVRQGDAVYTTAQQVCLVQRFLERDNDDGTTTVFMEGRWYLNQTEIVAKLGPTGLTPETEAFLDVLHGNEVVLSNLLDQNEASCIAGLCKIHYKKLTDDLMDTSALGAGDKICRYRLEIDAKKKTIYWVEFSDPKSASAAESNARPSPSAFSIEWLDDGPVGMENGNRIYHRAHIKTGNDRKPFLVRQGDAVYTTAQQVCLVQRFLERDNDDGTTLTFVEGSWCLNQTEIVAKLDPTGLQQEMDKVLSVLKENEVVRTNWTDKHETSCIARLCKIHYGKMSDAVTDTSAVGGGDKVCRYRLDIDSITKKICGVDLLDSRDYEGLGPGYFPEVDVDDESKVEKDSEEPEDVDMAEEDTVGTVLSGSDDDCDSLSTNRVPIQGEGSNFDGEIRVGAKFQMPVGPFHPNRRVRSRGAKQVYKANVLSDSELHQFLAEVARLHNRFLAQHKMTMKEPYILLHQERADDFVAHLPRGYPVTGSVMSTASSMGGGKDRVPLLKECNPDAILELLSDHGYNPAKALDAIRDDLDAISCGWTQPEKAVFDAGFRRHEGELREIGDVLFPTKSVRDVVDYHYRFKIPEQFRKYQTKKREQALRITQCIQNRKFGEAMNGGGNNALSVSSTTATWAEKSMADVTESSRHERLQAARSLLLDVKERLGKKKMVKVAGIVRKLQASYDRDTRDGLFVILHGEPHLQKRFLEFLPKNV